MSILLLSYSSFSQDLDSLVKVETIYFKTPSNSLVVDKTWSTPPETIIIMGDFVNEDYELKKHYRQSENPDLSYIRYSFFLDERDPLNNSRERTELSLSYSKYADFEQLASNNPQPFFKVHKRFIKNNRDLILTLDDFREMGAGYALWYLRKVKNIFLIDTSESVGKTVIIKEVSLSVIFPE